MSFDYVRRALTPLRTEEYLKAYVVYILECADSSYYTGSAVDLSLRISQHESGASPSAYTYSRRPVRLVWTSEETNRYSEALRWERQIKGWSRAKKQALIRGDFDAIHEIVKAERKRREQNKKNTPRWAKRPIGSAVEAWISKTLAIWLKRVLRLHSSQQALLTPLGTKRIYDNKNHSSLIYYPVRRSLR